jgi:hypothetical protein
MLNLSTLITDTGKENNGVTVELGGAKFVIASVTSERYKKALKKYLSPVQNQLALDLLQEGDAEVLMIKAMAEGLIISWDGLSEDGVTPLPYSVENAVKALTASRPLRNFIESEANKLANFRAAAETVESKN